MFGVKRKSYRLAGIAVAVMGAVVVLSGAIGFQSVSADPVVAEKADWSLLLIAGGAILIIAGIILSLWLFSSD